MVSLTPLNKSILSAVSGTEPDTIFRVVSQRSIDTLGNPIQHGQQLVVDFDGSCVLMRGNNQFITGFIRPDTKNEYVRPGGGYEVFLGEVGNVVTATTDKNLVVGNVRSMGERTNFKLRYLRAFGFKKDDESPYSFPEFPHAVSLNLGVDFVLEHPMNVYLQVVHLLNDKLVVGNKSLVCWTDELKVNSITSPEETFSYCIDEPVAITGSGIAIVASRDCSN